MDTQTKNDTLPGLSDTEVASRLRQHGYNELPSSQGRSVTALLGWQDVGDAIALCFATLVVANLGLIFANRSWSRTILATLRTPNQALWWVFGGTLFFLGLVLYVPFLRDLFHFSTLHPDDLALCLASGLVSILWFEGIKWLRTAPRSVG